MSKLEMIDGQLVEEPAKQTVRFYLHNAIDRAASEKAGKTRYKEMLYVQISTHGMRDSISRAATEDDKKNYPAQWKQFEQENADGGHAIDKLPNIEHHLVEQLRKDGIYTIETLAQYEGDDKEISKLADLAKGYIALYKPSNTKKK